MAESTIRNDVKRSAQNCAPVPNPDKSRAEGQELPEKIPLKRGRKPVPGEKKEKSDGRTAAFGVGEGVRKAEEGSWQAGKMCSK